MSLLRKVHRSSFHLPSATESKKGALTSDTWSRKVMSSRKKEMLLLLIVALFQDLGNILQMTDSNQSNQEFTARSFLSVSLNIWENCRSKGRKLRANQKYLKTPRRKMVISEFLPGVFPGIENSSTVRFGLTSSIENEHIVVAKPILKLL